nr:type I restriction-modification system subunit M N-terminal domain-containing protein [Aureispira sp. CCB-QB1]
MSEEHKKQLEQQLWNIANTLRGKMNADEFRDYILGFIFYKYLSEKMHLYANRLLAGEDIEEYTQIDEASAEGQCPFKCVSPNRRLNALNKVTI